MRKFSAAIVAQKLSDLLARRIVKRMAVGVVLPFFGIVAAFGIAPDTVTEQVATSRVVEALSLPGIAPIDFVEEPYWREERVQRGDTVATLLARLGIDDTRASSFLRGTREARALHQLAPGRTVRAQMDASGKLLELQYVNGQNLLKVERAGSGFQVSEQQAEVETRLQMQSGEIRSSLFAATDALGLPDAVAVQIAEIFSSDIDFHRDLRRGDRFSVIYETLYHVGEPLRTGRVLAAEFVNQGKSYQAVWFQLEDNPGGYYTPTGANLRKAFLRSPLEFSRISSGFTNARFHPVLQQWRAHRGVDYAAPAGTRVRATADGVVEFAGRQGAYGNLVVLRHQSRFTTWYAHLSGFGQNLRTGARVSQGQIIGFVGATGLATGPHLHYEFRTNGVHQDPLRVVMPAAPPITPNLKAAFDSVALPLAEHLALLRDVKLARLD